MDFAKNVMAAQGWKEGMGLGASGQGRSEAVQVKLKFDTKGIGETGHNNFEWWNHAYNQASSNIIVQSDSDSDGEIKVESQEVRVGMISTKPPKKAQRAVFYGSFVKAASLSVDLEDEPKDFSKRLTDEELFKATGGLTGHKAARHGNKLGGKLARLEAADKLLAKRIQQGVDFKTLVKESANDRPIMQKSKKKKRKSRNDDEVATMSTERSKKGKLLNEVQTFETYATESKAKKKSKKLKKEKKANKKKSSNIQSAAGADAEDSKHVESTSVKKNKKKKKDKN